MRLVTDYSCSEGRATTRCRSREEAWRSEGTETLMTLRDLLRSSLVSRHRENQGASRGERGHPNAKEAFRPGPLEYPRLEWIGMEPTRLRPIARAWKDSSLVFEMQCLDTCELLNTSPSSPQHHFHLARWHVKDSSISLTKDSQLLPPLRSANCWLSTRDAQAQPKDIHKLQEVTRWQRRSRS